METGAWKQERGNKRVKTAAATHKGDTGASGNLEQVVFLLAQLHQVKSAVERFIRRKTRGQMAIVPPANRPIVHRYSLATQGVLDLLAGGGHSRLHQQRSEVFREVCTIECASRQAILTQLQDIVLRQGIQGATE